MKQNTATISRENKSLERRLQELDKRKKQVMRNKEKIISHPVSYKEFLPRDKVYENVQSNLDYDHVKEINKVKIEQMARIKEKMEMQECSFKPKLNPKSEIYVKNSNYVPIDRRKPRNKTAEKIKSEEDIIEPLPNNKGPKRRIDEGFYEKQLQWQKNKTEKVQRKIVDKTINKSTEQKEIPKSNKKINEKIVSDKGPFSDRLALYKEKSEKLKKNLENKFYDYSFKPTINEDFTPTANGSTKKNILYMGPKHF